MNRRTENRLIGALSAIVVAGLLVMVVGVAMALTSGHSDNVATLASVSSPRIEATQLQAIASFPPELPPSKSPSFWPTPTPTVPLYGTPCREGDLVGPYVGGNGATGHNLMYFAIVNISGRGCDLPVISSIDEIGEDGTLLSSKEVVPESKCKPSLPFCISNYRSLERASVP